MFLFIILFKFKILNLENYKDNKYFYFDISIKN